jgi:hypothetical protein
MDTTTFDRIDAVLGRVETTAMIGESISRERMEAMRIARDIASKLKEYCAALKAMDAPADDYLEEALAQWEHWERRVSTANEEAKRFDDITQITTACTNTSTAVVSVYFPQRKGRLVDLKNTERAALEKLAQEVHEAIARLGLEDKIRGSIVRLTLDGPRQPNQSLLELLASAQAGLSVVSIEGRNPCSTLIPFRSLGEAVFGELYDRLGKDVSGSKLVAVGRVCGKPHLSESDFATFAKIDSELRELLGKLKQAHMSRDDQVRIANRQLLSIAAVLEAIDERRLPPPKLRGSERRNTAPDR